MQTQTSHADFSEFDQEFDLLVVGAGIYGIWVGYYATFAGLKVALVDRGDFGGCTSSNSLRIAHGGLRYLQSLDFRRMRQSIVERRELIRLAPDVVRSLQCLMPTNGFGRHNALILRAAFGVTDIIGFDRNKDIPVSSRIGNGSLVLQSQLEGESSHVRQHLGRVAAGWYDGVLTEPNQIMISLLRAAVSMGMVARNYVSADQLSAVGGKVVGAECRDVFDSSEFRIRARAVVNACGPSVDELCRPTSNCSRPAGQLYAHSRAFNIVLNRSVSDAAIAIHFESECAGTAFAVPMRGRTFIGTKHLPLTGDPGPRPCITNQEVGIFIGQLNRGMPGLDLGEEDIVDVLAGYLPMDPAESDYPCVTLLKHPKIVDHGELGGLDGLLSIVGVKWTTARHVAEKTAALVVERLGDRRVDDRMCDTRDRLAAARGSTQEVRVNYSDRTTAAEDVQQAITHEQVRSIGDYVFRRSALWMQPDRLHEFGREVCAVMSGYLSWDEEEEVRHYQAYTKEIERRSSWRPSSSAGLTAASRDSTRNVEGL